MKDKGRHLPAFVMGGENPSGVALLFQAATSCVGADGPAMSSSVATSKKYSRRGSTEGLALSPTLARLLGLRADATARRLRVDPILPPWLDWIELEGMRVGRARIDLRVERGRGGVVGTRTRTRRQGLRVEVARRARR